MQRLPPRRRMLPYEAWRLPAYAHVCKAWRAARRDEVHACLHAARSYICVSSHYSAYDSTGRPIACSHAVPRSRSAFSSRRWCFFLSPLFSFQHALHEPQTAATSPFFGGGMRVLFPPLFCRCSRALLAICLLWFVFSSFARCTR